MKDDSISRQVAIDALMEKDKKLRNINWYGNPYAEGECRGIDEALSIISNLPSAQTESKTGEWKHLKGDEWLCSNCGYVVWTEGSWEHPLGIGKDYCEHCGAYMRGKEDE